MMRCAFVAEAPDIKVLRSSANDFDRWEVQLVKDFCVPSLPKLLEEDERSVCASWIRERQRTANAPRRFMRARRETDPQSRPNSSGPAAMDEDVFIRF